MSQVAKEFHFDGPQRDEMLGGRVGTMGILGGFLRNISAAGV